MGRIESGAYCVDLRCCDRLVVRVAVCFGIGAILRRRIHHLAGSVLRRSERRRARVILRDRHGRRIGLHHSGSVGQEGSGQLAGHGGEWEGRQHAQRAETNDDGMGGWVDVWSGKIRQSGEGIFDGLKSCEDTGGWRGGRQLASPPRRVHVASHPPVTAINLIDGAGLTFTRAVPKPPP